jgi:hypothetical protein
MTFKQLEEDGAYLLLLIFNKHFDMEMRRVSLIYLIEGGTISHVPVEMKEFANGLWISPYGNAEGSQGNPPGHETREIFLLIDGIERTDDIAYDAAGGPISSNETVLRFVSHIVECGYHPEEDLIIKEIGSRQVFSVIAGAVADLDDVTSISTLKGAADNP